MKSKLYLVLGVVVAGLVIWLGVTIYGLIRGAPDANIQFSLEIVSVSDEDSLKPKVAVQIRPSHYSGQRMLVACDSDTRILYPVSKDLDIYTADCTNLRGRDVGILVELFNSSGYSVAFAGASDLTIPACSPGQRLNPFNDC